MRRRDFIASLGVVFTGRLAANAQQQPMPVIGFLHSTSPEAAAHYLTAFRQGLKETGYVEGLNLAIEFRWAQGDYSKLAALAGDLASCQVAVICTGGGAVPALAAKAATSTIPIVFAMLR